MQAPPVGMLAPMHSVVSGPLSRPRAPPRRPLHGSVTVDVVFKGIGRRSGGPHPGCPVPVHVLPVAAAQLGRLGPQV